MASSEEARRVTARLLEGNRAFVREVAGMTVPDKLAARLADAHPFAVVLSCADSRVPPERVLGSDIGELFVVRNAGHVAGTQEVGSIEYAVAQWGCPLVLVLGHTQCGAVAAALDTARSVTTLAPDAASATSLASLVVEVRTNLALAPRPPHAQAAPGDPWRAAVEANVRRTIEALGQRSGFLRGRVSDGRLAIVGAVYDVSTGEVALL